MISGLIIDNKIWPKHDADQAYYSGISQLYGSDESDFKFNL